MAKPIGRKKKSVLRGGRRVVIEDAIDIDTTSLYPLGNAILELRKYNGQWHLLHHYNSSAGYGTHCGTIGGETNTENTLRYLRSCQKVIRSDRTELDQIDKDLAEVIRKLEGER